MTALTAVDWVLPAAPDRIADMRTRLHASRFPASAVSGWQGGIDLDWLSGFASYLADSYDWAADRKRFGARHAMIPFDEAAGEGGLHVAPNHMNRLWLCLRARQRADCRFSCCMAGPVPGWNTRRLRHNWSKPDYTP